jgi:hypothetical protein
MRIDRSFQVYDFNVSRKILILVILGVFLSGCSSPVQSKYDEVDLIVYQNCIDKGTNGMVNFLNSEFYIDNAIEACKKYLPTKG